MKKCIKASRAIDTNEFEFDAHAPSSIFVSVDSHPLPLHIGSKFTLGNDDVERVVTKIQISEDGKVLYGVQCPNGTEFTLDWMTFEEMCYMHSNLKKNRGRIYINA